MCELLGLAFNKPISPGLSFRGFRQRAKRNRDGWGLAAITPTKARITKEAARADQSDVSESLRDDPLLKAPIFIGHVRFASCGDVNLENTVIRRAKTGHSSAPKTGHHVGGTRWKNRLIRFCWQGA